MLISATTNLNAAPITVGIADEHIQFCKALSQTITAQPGINVVFTAKDGNHLVEQALQYKPQVILTDIQMPVMDGIEASKLLQKLAPESAVIALSMYCDRHHVWQMYQAGARGYLTKGADEVQIYEAIMQVHTEGSYWCSTASQHLQQAINQRIGQLQEQSAICKQQFSELELRAMELICQEKHCKEVADEVHVPKRTMDSIYDRLRHKTGAKGLVGIALYAVRNGLAGVCAIVSITPNL